MHREEILGFSCKQWRTGKMAAGFKLLPFECFILFIAIICALIFIIVLDKSFNRIVISLL